MEHMKWYGLSTLYKGEIRRYMDRNRELVSLNTPGFEGIYLYFDTSYPVAIKSPVDGSISAKITAKGISKLEDEP